MNIGNLKVQGRVKQAKVYNTESLDAVSDARHESQEGSQQKKIRLGRYRKQEPGQQDEGAEIQAKDAHTRISMENLAGIWRTAADPVRSMADFSCLHCCSWPRAGPCLDTRKTLWFTR